MKNKKLNEMIGWAVGTALVQTMRHLATLLSCLSSLSCPRRHKNAHKMPIYKKRRQSTVSQLLIRLLYLIFCISLYICHVHVILTLA